MELINHTPFPAGAFEGIDPHGRRFHVVVLRQTFSFTKDGLMFSVPQSPLCETDVAFEDSDNGELRAESDLCPYKPKCDVILNGVAYSPGGIPHASFLVRLELRRSGSSSQYAGGAYDNMGRGTAAVPTAEDEKVHVKEKILISKSLCVSGGSQYRRKKRMADFFALFVRYATMNRVRPSSWTRTDPSAITTLPLRYKHAFGGQVRIEASDPAAEHIPQQYRAGGDGSSAHIVYERNPSGVGFTHNWVTKAKRQFEWSAPQIEWMGRAVTPSLFEKVLQSPSSPGCLTSPDLVPAVLCARNKTDPDRVSLLGTVDDSFINSGRPLPEDFDFAYFNSAPPDQQVPWLSGNEVFELTNLCPRNTPGLGLDEQGNSVLSMRLPRQECFVSIRSQTGMTSSHQMVIDTVIIEPSVQRVIVVWRRAIAFDSLRPVQTCAVHTRATDKCKWIEAASISQISRAAEKVQIEPALLGAFDVR